MWQTNIQRQRQTLQGRIRMVGTQARAHPIFLDLFSYAPHIRRPC